VANEDYKVLDCEPGTYVPGLSAPHN